MSGPTDKPHRSWIPQDATASTVGGQAAPRGNPPACDRQRLGGRISAYGTVLLLGLLGRFDVAATSEVLTRTDVLMVAGLLTLVELVADWVPYLDSAWDVVHTVIRPFTAAVIGVLLAGDVSTLEQAVTAIGMGGLALLSHAAKAALRLAVNSSREPVTNVGVSLGEDVAVTGVVLLAWSHPWLVAALALLLAVALVLAMVLLGAVRRGLRRLRGRLGGT